MHTRLLLCVVVAAGIAGAATPAHAVDDNASAPVPDPVTGTTADLNADFEPDVAFDEKPWGGTADNTLKLSLADAIAKGLENNLGIQVQRFGPLIAEEGESIAWGAYDPVWASEIGWDETRTPQSSLLVGVPLSVTKTLDGNGGLHGLLPLLSTQYSVTLDSRRVISNSPFSNLSPEYRTTTVFTLTQPLLRGLIWNEPWTRVKISKIEYESSLEAFSLELMNIIAAIEDSYWILIADHENMIVAEKSLDTSQALLDQTRIQYDVGVISRVEVTQAEAGVADREFKLIVAENVYDNSQDRLITLVLGEQLHPDTTLAIEPTDGAGDYLPYDIDVPDATQLAFEHRPEIQLADKEIERLEIQEKFAKSGRLPQLDVKGSYAYKGLSGRQNPNLVTGFGSGSPVPVPPGSVPSNDYGNSYDDFYDPDGANNWSIRGVFSIPIPNTSARHRLTQAEIQLRQARTKKRRTELDVITEVREAARSIKAAQEGIDAAERAVAAAQEQLRAEEIRLEYGESTPYDVLLREEDLVQAESQKIAAFRTYRTSLTALDRRQGTILRNRNIAIDDILSLR